MPDIPAHRNQLARVYPSRRKVLLSTWGLAVGAGTGALTACGGALGDEANVRFSNGTVDYSSVDFSVAGSKVVSALANAGATSNWVTIDSGDNQINLYSAGSSSAKLSETRKFSEDTYTSVLAYGSLGSSIKLRYIDESNAVPESGVKLRLLHAAPGLAGVDVYVTNTSSLSGLAPSLSAASFDTLTDFVAVGADSYRVRITSAGNQSNVLFDLPEKVNLVGKSVTTLVIVPRATGSLPNVLALPEKSGAVLLPNSLAS